MSRKMPEGICNICGRRTKLSFEHVPPASALNDRRVILSDVDAYWNRGPGQGLPATGRPFQRGYGGNTLCIECNNLTGRWYAYYFAEWCKRGSEYYRLTKGVGAVLQFTTIFPLPVIKQIVTMFLARHGDHFRADKKESLVRFVLNKELRGFDPEFRLWTYLVAPGPLRDTPFCAVLDVVTGRCLQGMELSFPPFGYMMTIDSLPNNRNLREITHFSRYGYNHMAMMDLQLGILPTHTPTLGDYRTFKNIDSDQDQPNVVLKPFG